MRHRLAAHVLGPVSYTHLDVYKRQVYRIERLEKAYGFDLADANVRFEFLLVGKAMETLLPS